MVDVLHSYLCLQCYSLFIDLIGGPQCEKLSTYVTQFLQLAQLYHSIPHLPDDCTVASCQRLPVISLQFPTILKPTAGWKQGFRVLFVVKILHTSRILVLYLRFHGYCIKSTWKCCTVPRYICMKPVILIKVRPIEFDSNKSKTTGQMKAVK